MYKCQKCGSTEIQVKEWVELNSGKNCGAVEENLNEPDNNWCPKCEEHCIIIDKDE